GANTAGALRLCDDMERQRGLARAFRAENLDDTAARQPADAERDIEPDRAGGDRLDIDRGVLAQLHHRALAVIALDLAESGFQRLVLVHSPPVDHAKFRQ